jgi:SAM-dependent methyltransferase
MLETEKTHVDYDRFYADQWHWRYGTPRGRLYEWVKVRFKIIRRYRIQEGSRVLELACGQGYHVDLMRRLGMDVVGVDISRKGIEFARKQFPKSTYYHVDATEDLPFPKEHFDVIWSHGAGFFHYDVTDAETEAVVRSHLQNLRSGGLYIVVISTDLSGRKPPGRTDQVWMNTLDDYRSMLRRHGMPFTVQWDADRAWLPLIGPRLPTGLVYCSLRKTTEASVPRGSIASASPSG